MLSVLCNASCSILGLQGMLRTWRGDQANSTNAGIRQIGKKLEKNPVFFSILFLQSPHALAGIVPYINASIILQLLSTSFPSLKKLQREEGPQGRARFQLYQKLAALVFAIFQSVGQLTYIRPFVTDFSTDWLVLNSLTLTAGAMILVQVSF